MALRTDDDPYPPSLPRMNSPDMSLYGQSSSASANHPFDQLYPDNAADAIDGSDAEHAFSDALQMPPESYETTVHPADLSLGTFPSPESSASSSRSSGEHKRHASSNSSRSATFEYESLVPDAAQMNKLRLEGYKTTAESPKRDLDAIAAQSDIDRQMNELFDFDSAANSPGDSVTTKTSADKSISGMVMSQDERSPYQPERPILHPQNRKRPAVSSSFIEISTTTTLVDLTDGGLTNLPSLHRRLDLWLPLLPASGPKLRGGNLLHKVCHSVLLATQCSRTTSLVLRSTAHLLFQLWQPIRDSWVQVTSVICNLRSFHRRTCSTVQPISSSKWALGFKYIQYHQRLGLRPRFRLQ